MAPSPFIIGCWLPRADALAGFAELGVTHAFGFDAEGGVTSAATFAAAAAANKVLPVTAPPVPIPSPALDAGGPAWFLEPDEPDGLGGVPPAGMQAKANAMRAAGSKRELFLSLDANKMPWRVLADYVEYAKAATWLAEDYYPANTGGTLADKLLRVLVLRGAANVATQLDGRPRKVFSFVEASDQGLTWPTAKRPLLAAEILAQAKALRPLVDGIIWFTQRVPEAPGGFLANVCTPDQLAAVKAANAMLAQGPPPTQSPPSGLTVIVSGYQTVAVPLVPLG